MLKTIYIVENEDKIKKLKNVLNADSYGFEENKGFTVLINYTLEFIESNVFRVESDKSDTSNKELLYFESDTIGSYEKVLETEDYTYYALEGSFHNYA